jgi:hypothetical protein
MKIRVAWWVVVVAALASAPAAAQPDGPYKGDCRSISVANDILAAFCATMGGGESFSFLPISRCAPNSILNDDGRLRCSDAALPQGDYAGSCENLYVFANTLFGRCKDERGVRRRSQLDDAFGCIDRGGSINNTGGTLTCDAPAGNQPRTPAPR